MKTLTLTREEKIETLYLKAEEVSLQSMLLTRRGLAHGHTDFGAHVLTFRADVRPVDSRYNGPDDHTNPVAELIIDLSPYEWSLPEVEEQKFQEQMAEIEKYISYLDYLIELGKPVLVEAIGGAA